MTRGDARQQAADKLARLRAEIESGRNVSGAWLDEDAEWLLDEYALLLARVQEQADEIAKHANDLAFFGDNTDEYFDKWRDAERRVQEAERALHLIAYSHGGAYELIGSLRAIARKHLESVGGDVQGTGRID